jgi:hypothetical protein
MRAFKILAFPMLIAVLCVMAGCTWSVSVKRKAGQPVEVDGTISGNFPAAIRAMSARLAVISPTTLYIDTTGTDYNLDSTGQITVSLTNSGGTIVAAKSFAWVKAGTKLEFQDPASVQSWMNQYPTAANAAYTLNPGNTPVDGVDHVVSTAVIYNRAVQASASATFAAQCYTRYHTIAPCMQ